MYTKPKSIQLHSLVDGPPNGPTLVFINSLGCNLHIWDEVAPAFTDHYRVVRYDKRGHGLSEVTPGPYTIRDHTNDLDRLLTSLDAREVVLIGISVGGLIAMDYAALKPSRVRALVLSDTAPRI